MKGRKRTVKKLAALVLVLILCFSVSIGGTYAIQNGATGPLATDVFVAESIGANVEIAAGERIKLLPGVTADGSAIQITTGESDATVTLKFSVPTLNGEPVIKITADGWTKNGYEFTKTLSKQKNYKLSEFKFTLDSRIDIVDGEMVVVEKGEIKDLNWDEVGDTGYIKIEATVGVLSSGILNNKE